MSGFTLPAPEAVRAALAGLPLAALRHERMNDAFDKWHIEGLPFAAALHRFTAPDHGDPHDHPWGFTSFVLSGGYGEEVFARDPADPRGWSTMLHWRAPGSVHQVAATHIHRIGRVGECWTLVLPGPAERETRFWRFDDDGAVWSRPWFRAEFKRDEVEA